MNKETLAIGRQWLIKHHRQVIFLLLCAGLLISLSVHLFRIIGDLMTEPPELVTESPAPEKKMLLVKDFRLLFGEAQDKPRLAKNADIPKTNLNLTLRGALAGSEGVVSSAIIQGSDGQDQLYRVGDFIPGGAQLNSVHPRHVVISYNGKLQKLLFPEIKADNQGVQPYTPPPPSAVDKASLPPGPVSEASQNATSEMDQKLESLRQRVE